MQTLGGINVDLEETVKFINRSSYRLKIVKSIGTGVKMPKTISLETGLLLNHVSYSLKLLRKKGIVVCLNPDAYKGRLYKLTDIGLKSLKCLK